MAAHAEYKKVLVNYNKLYKALKPIYHGTAVAADAVQPNSKHIAGKSNSSSGAGGGGGITMSDALQHTTTSASADSEKTIVRYTIALRCKLTAHCYGTWQSGTAQPCIHAAYIVLYCVNPTLTQPAGVCTSQVNHSSSN
jgi:hypothetical protein